MNDPTHNIPAIAQKIKKLEARSAAIKRRLELPCPTKYGNKEASNDYLELLYFTGLRADETALTEAQQAEEAHVRARYDVFCESPEAIARRRFQELQHADRRFRMYRLFGDSYAPPLSRKERSALKLLRWLYPAPPKPILSELDDFESGIYRDHPFAHELPAPNGNFYPRDSKLYPRHCKVTPADPQGYAADDLAKDRERLDQLRMARSEGEILAREEDAEATQLAARIATYEPDLDEARIRELEARRAGFPLTQSEEAELRDLRDRHPEFAAVMDLMDFVYLHEWRRELEIARKAGLDYNAMCEQAEVCCLRVRDESKFLHEWQARNHMRDRRGEAGRDRRSAA